MKEGPHCKASVHCSPGLHYCKLDRNLLAFSALVNAQRQLTMWASWRSAKKGKIRLLVDVKSIVREERLSHRPREK